MGSTNRFLRLAATVVLPATLISRNVIALLGPEMGNKGIDDAVVSLPVNVQVEIPGPFRIHTNPTKKSSGNAIDYKGDSTDTNGSNPKLIRIEASSLFRPADMAKYLARGPNFWFAADTGCQVSMWVFDTGNFKFRDCVAVNRKIEGREHLVQPYDTIYVPSRMIRPFLAISLSNITVPFVLLSGQFTYTPGEQPGRVKKFLVKQLLAHPMLLMWFVQNPPFYLFIKEPHPKLASLPYGFQRHHYDRHRNKKPPPETVLREAFLRHVDIPKKTKGILYGWINPLSSKSRTGIPFDDRLPLAEFYDEVAKSRFVVSPSGDRPDCYRHYEALAFGAIPITDLNPIWYDHFNEAPVVYQTTDWTNLTEEDLVRGLNQRSFSMSNRKMVFEEYWLEHVDRMVGRPVRWWDRHALGGGFLKDFVNFTLN